VQQLLQLLATGDEGHAVEVQLSTQIVVYPGGRTVPFAIDGGRKAALLSGLDEIGRTLNRQAAIDAFVIRDRELRPWIYDPPLNADRT